MGVLFLQMAVLEQSNRFLMTVIDCIGFRDHREKKKVKPKCETEMFRDNILYINMCCRNPYYFYVLTFIRHFHKLL